MCDIRNYIEAQLLAPNAAKRLLTDMSKAINNLQTMPNRHKLIDEEPWRSEGIRKIIVRNYYIYYWIDESQNKVYITAVVYGKRDQTKQLTTIVQD